MLQWIILARQFFSDFSTIYNFYTIITNWFSTSQTAPQFVIIVKDKEVHKVAKDGTVEQIDKSSLGSYNLTKVMEDKMSSSFVATEI